MPISMMRDWCLYVFDMHLKKLNVLDPVFTQMGSDAYRAKHRKTIMLMLNGMKRAGALLDDGWKMTVRCNMNMHVACGRCVDCALYI